MGYLFHILAATAIQALGESELVVPWRFPLGVLALAAVPHVLAARVRALALRGAIRRADWIARILQHSPVVLHLVAVAGLGWVQTVQEWTGAELLLVGWPRPALALALLPYVVYELVAIDAYARAHELGRKERAGVRAFQTRMFLSALAPLAMYLALASLVGWSDALRVRIERVALAHAIFVTSLLVLLALALPAILRNTWETEAIGPGPVREQFDAVAARAGFRASSLLEWKTGNLMANAMIVGMLARNRVVLFSDSLLRILAPAELSAVFAHEIGHAQRHHVAIFLTWIVAFFLGGDLAVSWIGSQEGLGGDWAAAGVGAALLLVWFLVFGWLSRRFELEADLYALELLGDPDGMIGALERVGGRLRDVAGWRHFSTADRVSFIWRATSDPGFVRRFRTMLKRVTALGVVLALAMVALELRVLARSWPTDQLLVDLTLGRYASAADRVGSIETADAWLVELGEEAARLADELGPTPSRDDVVGALRESLERGELIAARARAGLLEVRGERWAAPIARALDAAAAGAAERAELALEDVDPDWRAHVAPLVRARAPR